MRECSNPCPTPTLTSPPAGPCRGGKASWDSDQQHCSYQASFPAKPLGCCAPSSSFLSSFLPPSSLSLAQEDSEQHSWLNQMSDHKTVSGWEAERTHSRPLAQQLRAI